MATKKKYVCVKCSHTWDPKRKDPQKQIKPLSCPRCKSYEWKGR